MEQIIYLLQKIGLSPKAAKVYRVLLGLGPASVRTVASAAGLNRGTTYDMLRNLVERGLATYAEKSHRQHFVAEGPEVLLAHLRRQREQLATLDTELEAALPILRSVQSGAAKPVVKYYEGTKGIRTILEDVLETTKGFYRVYSTAGLREYLYESFPTFTRERVRQKIPVRVIALGKWSVGELPPLSERRILPGVDSAPTYRIIYGNKTASIALRPPREFVSVLVEDPSLTTTEQLIFDALWILL